MGKPTTKIRRHVMHFTAGEAARLVGCAPRTMSAWIDRGRLPGAFRLPAAQGGPGKGDARRVPRAAMLRFLRHHGMPVPEWLGGTPRLLLASPSDALEAALGSALPGWEVTRRPTLFAAGAALAALPHALLLDLCLGRAECLAALRGVTTPAYALCCEDEADLPGVLAAGFRAAWVAPADPALIAAAVALLED